MLVKEKHKEKLKSDTAYRQGYMDALSDVIEAIHDNGKAQEKICGRAFADFKANQKKAEQCPTGFYEVYGKSLYRTEGGLAMLAIFESIVMPNMLTEVRRLI